MISFKFIALIGVSGENDHCGFIDSTDSSMTASLSSEHRVVDAVQVDIGDFVFALHYYFFMFSDDYR